jgi:hypothetical protein
MITGRNWKTMCPNRSSCRRPSCKTKSPVLAGRAFCVGEAGTGKPVLTLYPFELITEIRYAFGHYFGYFRYHAFE